MGHKLLPPEGLEQELPRALPTLCGGLSAQHQPVAAGDRLEAAAALAAHRGTRLPAAPPVRALLGGEGVPSPLRKVLKNAAFQCPGGALLRLECLPWYPTLSLPLLCLPPGASDP